ncbi:hypothetical protein ABEF95_001747 [Exophiala dermatitidis]
MSSDDDVSLSALEGYLPPTTFFKPLFRRRGDPEDMATAVKLSEIVEDLSKLNQAFQQSESIFQDGMGTKVFRHGNIVLKFGLGVSPFEAKTLQFMRQTTNVPVPWLYRDHVHADGTAVLAMEYIEGHVLSELWPSLRPDEKMNIVGQLREILDEMRRHRSNIIGGIHDTPAVDARKSRHKGGPFATEQRFNEFLRSDMIPNAPRLYYSMLERAMKNDHDIVLTHGDINPRNIMVNDGQIVAILDWETGGWYPEYWEYIKFFNALDSSLDWVDYADKIFSKTYFGEFLADSFLERFLRH